MVEHPRPLHYSAALVCISTFHLSQRKIAHLERLLEGTQKEFPVFWGLEQREAQAAFDMYRGADGSAYQVLSVVVCNQNKPQKMTKNAVQR